MQPLGYRAFDADNHYYEPRDCFTRHIEPRLRDRAVHVRPNPATGRDDIWVGDKPFTFLPHRTFDATVKPGKLREMLRGLGKDGRHGPDSSEYVESMQPEYQGREARLAVMDRQGLEAILIFPTIAVTLEHFMRDDAEQMYGNLQAFNTWLDETWGFAHQGRIFAPPLISMLECKRAVDQLEWALRRGTRAVCLRPGPFYGRSPADPHFDPFWARVNEAGVLVAYHITESGYNEMMSVHFGEAPNPPSHGQSALQWTCFYGDRPIMDTVAALIFGNLFGRFPNVRVISVENGSLWVPYLMRVMDKMGGMARNGPWIGGRIHEKPSEIMRRHVFVSPHHFGEDLLELARVLGPSQILFGSDFPHGEGLPEPLEFARRLEGLPADDVRRIMRDNARGLLGTTA
jgi:predicted TIM-barrel fold metal-dependent hydrolase